MRLSQKRLDGLLNRTGQQMNHRRAYDCPCRNANSGASDPGCPVCGGAGIIWQAPVLGVAALAGQKIQREWAQFGEFESGDTVLSIPSDSPLYAMGEHDRLTFLNTTAPFSITLTRGDDDVLRFKTVCIDRVFWLVAGAIVEGGIPSVDDAGVMTWPSGEPPAGVQYSITGRKHPEYFCWKDYPQDRAHHKGVALPRKVVVRLFNLFERSL